MTNNIEFSNAASLRNDLVSWRRTAAGARNKARRVYAALLELTKLEVLLPAERTLDFLAHSIYFSGSYDAGMRYGSVDEFKEELIKELKAKWPIERELDGKQYYVATPVFDDDRTDLDTQLGWSFRACKLSELASLKVEPLDEAGMHPGMTGLSVSEFKALIDMHRSDVTSITNVLRRLETALHYPVSFLKRYSTTTLKREVNPVIPDDTLDRIRALRDEVHLPGVEPVPPHFGSDWDAKGKVRNLTLGCDLAAYFRTLA
jgi:hypothetical protein